MSTINLFGDFPAVGQCQLSHTQLTGPHSLDTVGILVCKFWHVVTLQTEVQPIDDRRTLVESNNIILSLMIQEALKNLKTHEVQNYSHQLSYEHRCIVTSS